MDNLTHTLLGVTMANAGLSKRFGKGTLLFMALVSNFPDLDVFWKFVDSDPSFAFRRMFTHSIVGGPVLALFAAGLFRLFYKNISFKTFFGLGLLAIGFHVLYDLMNSYGVVVLFPFSRTRYELGWLFIIDLALWAIMILPLFLSFIKTRFTTLERLSLIALVFTGIYTLGCGLGHFVSQRLLVKHAAQQKTPADFIYIFPEALGPHRFRGVIRSGLDYEMFLITWPTGSIQSIEKYHTDLDDSQVQAARETKRGQQLEWFFKAPVWTKNRNGVEVTDLRFRSTVVFRRRAPFVYRFP